MKLKIKEYRIAKGFTQEELAKMSGTWQDRLSMYERGLSTPTLGTLEKLAKVLDVKVQDLIDEEDECSPRDDSV